uniref:Uncharacterized protein n=1 Tax=Anguilla anguilla TaxID=7936 RepID=A0A0E9RW44_ANGAN
MKYDLQIIEYKRGQDLVFFCKKQSKNLFG